MKYQIINYDNGRYMDDEGRWAGPEFDDALDALEHARSVVNEDLRSLKTDGMTPEELYTQYTMFGTEPQIVSAGEEIFFSAWDYAKGQCHELCGETDTQVAAAESYELKYWFIVEHDEKGIRLNVSPPGRERWEAAIAWDSILRVCFKAEGPMESDGVYIFVRERPESYVIPMEGSGASDLWAELIRRRLFDAETAIRAAAAVDKLFCWPPADSEVP